MKIWRGAGIAGVAIASALGARVQPSNPERPRPINEIEAARLAESAALAAVDAALDAFHAAASKADKPAYVGLMSRQFVFLGTDATERWERASFIEFLTPYFDSGKGWTYHPRARQVVLGAEDRVTWFDELLDNEKLGECRGSGVLVIEDGAWKLAQYNLSIPIPNALAEEFAAKIRGR